MQKPDITQFLRLRTFDNLASERCTEYLLQGCNWRGAPAARRQPVTSSIRFGLPGPRPWNGVTADPLEAV